MTTHHGPWGSWFLDLFHFPDHRNPKMTRFWCAGVPVVGRPTIVSIGSRDASEAHLLLEDEWTTLFEGNVPPNGQIVFIPVSTTKMTFKLELTPLRASCDCVASTRYLMTRYAKAKPLRFRRARTWWFAFAGKPFPVSWDCPGADKVEVFLDDGYNPKPPIIAGKKDSLLIYREVPGKVIIRLVAKNQHTSTTETRVVWVFAGRPRIAIAKRVQRAVPGAQVTFSFMMANAQEAWLEAPARNETHPLELVGNISLKMGEETEQFILRARRMNITRSVVLTAVPISGLEAA
jgi:hypothetical protein